MGRRRERSGGRHRLYPQETKALVREQSERMCALQGGVRRLELGKRPKSGSACRRTYLVPPHWPRLPTQGKFFARGQERRHHPHFPKPRNQPSPPTKIIGDLPKHHQSIGRELGLRGEPFTPYSGSRYFFSLPGCHRLQFSTGGFHVAQSVLDGRGGGPVCRHE
jgi:hypothetical protein